MDKTKKPEQKKPAEQKKDEHSCCGQCVGKENAECENCVKLSSEVEEYKSKYLRAIADYQNYERRVQDQRTEWVKNANKNLILKLLSFLDDLERAEAFVKDQSLAHIKETFLKMLTSEGLEEIDVIDKLYDPYTAEVIDIKEGQEDDMVQAVLRKGYMYNGQLLRVAQVTVSKKKQ